MSLTTAIVLNAVLDLAVIVALTWLMRVPFRLDRAVRVDSLPAQSAAPTSAARPSAAEVPSNEAGVTGAAKAAMRWHAGVELETAAGPERRRT